VKQTERVAEFVRQYCLEIASLLWLTRLGRFFLVRRPEHICIQINVGLRDFPAV
jgi:hypothetical protein